MRVQYVLYLLYFFLWNENYAYLKKRKEEKIAYIYLKQSVVYQKLTLIHILI